MKCGRLIQRTDLTSLLQVRGEPWSYYTEKERNNGNLASNGDCITYFQKLRSLKLSPFYTQGKVFNLFHNRIHLKHLQPLSVPHLSQAGEQASGMDFIKQSGATQEPRKLSPPPPPLLPF